VIGIDNLGVVDKLVDACPGRQSGEWSALARSCGASIAMSSERLGGSFDAETV
jgi:hypothetical protein